MPCHRGEWQYDAGPGLGNLRDPPLPKLRHVRRHSPVSLLGIYRRLLLYAWPQRFRLFLGVLAALANAAGGAGYAYLVGPLLKTLLAGHAETTGRFPLSALPALLIAVALVKGVSGWTYTALM